MDLAGGVVAEREAHPQAPIKPDHPPANQAHLTAIPNLAILHLA